MNLEHLAQSNILEVLHVVDAPEEKKQEVIDAATDIIIRSAMDRIKESFSEKERGEFEHAFDEKSTTTEHTAFLQKYAKKIEEVIIQESLRYKSLLSIISSSTQK